MQSILPIAIAILSIIAEGEGLRCYMCSNGKQEGMKNCGMAFSKTDSRCIQECKDSTHCIEAVSSSTSLNGPKNKIAQVTLRGCGTFNSTSEIFYVDYPTDERVEFEGSTNVKYNNGEICSSVPVIPNEASKTRKDEGQICFCPTSLCNGKKSDYVETNSGKSTELHIMFNYLFMFVTILLIV